jgi:hypothetical protein
MKVAYVWSKKAPDTFEFKGRVRPPDELYVELAFRDLGVEITRHHYHPTLFLDLQKAGPDLVLFSHPPQGWGSTQVAAIKKVVPKARLAMLAFDLSFHESDPTREERWVGFVKHLDFLAAKEDGRQGFWNKQGVNFFRAVQGHHPYVEKVWRPMPQGRKDKRPVLFFGSYSERRDIVLSHLQKALGDDLHVHSQTGGWKHTKKIRPCVFGPDRNDLLAGASCVVDINNGKGVAGHHSDRVEDVLAAGVPLLTELEHGDHDFVDGTHLIHWTQRDNVLWWINKLRSTPDLGARLSGEGSRLVRQAFTYQRTAEDILDAAAAFQERHQEIPVALPPEDVRSDILVDPVLSPVTSSRRNVLVLGQWRAQGLGYLSQRIVQVVENAGGTVKVASVNRNPEWDMEHRHERNEPPPDGTDAIIFLEKADDRWFDWAKSKEVRTIYFPMWEFFREEPEVRWAMAADIVAAVPGVAEGIENELGRPVRKVEWDPGMRPWRPFFPPDTVFFHDARGIEQGKYDLRPRCHTDVVLAAYRKVHGRRKREGKQTGLVLRCKNRPLPSENTHGIVSYERDYLSRWTMLLQVYGSVAAICPAAPEGFGLPYAEFQALGVVPIVLDVPPATAYVTHMKDGVCVPAIDEGPRSLARLWRPDEEALTEAIYEVSKPEVYRELKMGCYQTARKREGAFDRFLLGLLDG